MANLTVGEYVFIIDNEDAGLVSPYSWHLQKTQRGVYARTETRRRGERVVVALHRLLTNCPKGKEVDHINGNTLDNRRSNLRVCTHSQNMANARIGIGKTGYRGVWAHRSGTRWAAYITCKKKRKYLGLFKSPEEAALAWNREATKNFGAFARLNKVEVQGE